MRSTHHIIPREPDPWVVHDRATCESCVLAVAMHDRGWTDARAAMLVDGIMDCPLRRTMLRAIIHLHARGIPPTIERLAVLLADVPTLRTLDIVAELREVAAFGADTIDWRAVADRLLRRLWAATVAYYIRGDLTRAAAMESTDEMLRACRMILTTYAEPMVETRRAAA